MKTINRFKDTDKKLLFSKKKRWCRGRRDKEAGPQVRTVIDLKSESARPFRLAHDFYSALCNTAVGKIWLGEMDVLGNWIRLP